MITSLTGFRLMGQQLDFKEIRFWSGKSLLLLLNKMDFRSSQGAFR
jgi:hypothetical protein